MGNKSILLVCILVGAILMGASPVQGQLVSQLRLLIRIQGIVYCTANGNVGINGTSTPVFANAVVQLRRGNGSVVSSVTTINSGQFSILLDPLHFQLSAVISNFNIVVNTSLSSCNSSLPSVGGLQSPLRLIGNTTVGLLNIVNIIPSGFRIVATLN